MDAQISLPKSISNRRKETQANLCGLKRQTTSGQVLQVGEWETDHMEYSGDYKENACNPGYTRVPYWKNILFDQSKSKTRK